MPRFAESEQMQDDMDAATERAVKSASNRFQVLSLDGGGIRGMFTACFLAAIEEDTGKRVVDHFDLVAGTSTGGIIALGLGLGLSPADLLKFYLDYGPQIFSNRFGWRSLLHWVRAKFPRQPLHEALIKAF